MSEKTTVTVIFHQEFFDGTEREATTTISSESKDIDVAVEAFRASLFAAGFSLETINSVFADE